VKDPYVVVELHSVQNSERIAVVFEHDLENTCAECLS
jgi:hypothetical protein